MKICLINPEGVNKGLNLGLAYLSEYISQDPSVKEIKVIDLNNWKRDFKDVLKEVIAFDVIGFSVQSATCETAKKLIEKVKTSDNLIIVGGPHISIDGENYLKENPQIDFGFIRESDLTIKRFLKYLNGKEKLENIPGLIYRENSKIIVNKDLELQKNLDNLPFPNFDYFDSVNKKIDQYPLITSRGCPYSCSYCCVNKIVGKEWLSRSPEILIAELKHAKEKYHSNHFAILDDNFTLDVKRAKKFCELLINENLNMSWECQSGIRCDRIDEELFNVMKKSGCDAVTLGIESGSQKVFDKIKKGETLEDIENAIKLAKKVGLRTRGFFIIGLPGATVDDEYKSIRFAKKIKLDQAIFGLLVPYPGTEVWDWAIKGSYFIGDWYKSKHFSGTIDSVIETKEFSREDRIKMFKMANTKCHTYIALINEQDFIVKNAFIILSCILIYDTHNLHSHIIWLLKATPRIYRRVFGLIT